MEPAEADWTKLTEGKLPTYKSRAFYELLDRLGVGLAEFRQLPVYRRAVDAGLIADDEWPLVEFALTQSLADELWKLLADLKEHPLKTRNGEPFKVVSIKPDFSKSKHELSIQRRNEFSPTGHNRTEDAVDIQIISTRDREQIARSEIELAATPWLRGAPFTDDNVRAVLESSRPASRRSRFVLALLIEVEPVLSKFVFSDPGCQQYPVIGRLR